MTTDQFPKATLRIALAQINPTVGDITGNMQLMVQHVEALHRQHSPDLIVFPELSLTGYPPEDLLYRQQFLAEIEQLIREANFPCDVLLGAPHRQDGALFNAAYHLSRGSVCAIYHKQSLPNYGVFDEKRYFQSGSEAGVVDIAGVKLGICICEDMWTVAPARMAAEAGAQALISLNASPYHQGKQAEREAQATARARENRLPLAYVNLCGAQDEVVFDGGSFAVDAGGQLAARTVQFDETAMVLDFDGRHFTPVEAAVAPQPEPLEEVYGALVQAVRDYVNKNRFPGVVLGLSGGIDSALTLAVAVDALGPERVEAIMMPSRYTSDMSLEDAEQIARNFAVRYHIAAIESTFRAALAELAPLFEGRPVDTTEENMQARIRGMMVMAASNKKNLMVLTTGNKSEYAVGYSTLYGDMVGGYAPLKDVSKTLVFQLCEWRNRNGEMIPQRIIDRPPSAELAPDQKDEDTLPPYDILDQILERYVERLESAEEIIAAGFDPDHVRDTIRRVNINEYKRRQAAPGVKITRYAFGRERRYPITSGFGK